MQQRVKHKYQVPAIVAVVLVVVFLIIYMIARPESSAGEKQVVIEVIQDGSTIETFTIDTDREYLGELLLEEELAEGEDGPYGLYIMTVSGVTADESAQEWWCITKDGEMHMLSADETPLADGDKYELTLKAGYDE